MSQILSDTVTMQRDNTVVLSDIETELTKRYGEIIRWAVVECDKQALKISFSYVKE